MANQTFLGYAYWKAERKQVLTEPRSLKIERPQSLSESAADHIREAIIRGEFHLGEALTESSLSKLLGISKTPVREAFASLKREGLLQGDSQKGARVFTLTADQLRQLCAYRFTLEASALELALEQFPDGLIKRLTGICNNMETAHLTDDFDGYMHLDRDFHDTFFEFSGNQFLQHGYRSVSHKVSTLRTHLSRAPKRIDKSYAEHLEITKHLKANNLKKATRVLRKQIDRGSNAIDEITRAQG